MAAINVGNVHGANLKPCWKDWQFNQLEMLQHWFLWKWIRSIQNFKIYSKSLESALRICCFQLTLKWGQTLEGWSQQWKIYGSCGDDGLSGAVDEGGDGGDVVLVGDVVLGGDDVPGGDVVLGEGNLTAIREQRKAELCLEVRAGTPGVNTATAGPSFDKKLSQFRSSILFGQKSMQFFHISIVVWILARCWDNCQARTGFVGNVGNARWYWSCEFKDIFSYRNFMILKFSLECIGLYSCRYLDILQARTDCTKWCQMKWHWKVGGAREPEGGGWRWWWWWPIVGSQRREIGRNSGSPAIIILKMTKV